MTSGHCDAVDRSSPLVVSLCWFSSCSPALLHHTVFSISLTLSVFHVFLFSFFFFVPYCVLSLYRNLFLPLLTLHQTVFSISLNLSPSPRHPFSPLFFFLVSLSLRVMSSLFLSLSTSRPPVPLHQNIQYFSHPFTVPSSSSLMFFLPSSISFSLYPVFSLSLSYSYSFPYCTSSNSF